MKGIVLAGGTGSRLAPLTLATNKALLPVGSWPMIWHPINKLHQVGIRDIMIVTSRDHMGDVVRCLGSGRDLLVELTYRVQDEAGGIAQALGLCGPWAGEDDVLVILADNIFEDDLSAWLSGAGCCLWLKNVTNPSRFGVAKLNDDGKLVEIIEKPTDWEGPGYAVTGIYGYDKRVWDVIAKLTPSARGELEITDVNNAYLAMGAVEYRILEGWWTDAGTLESYERANMLVRAADGTNPLSDYLAQTLPQAIDCHYCGKPTLRSPKPNHPATCHLCVDEADEERATNVLMPGSKIVVDDTRSLDAQVAGLLKRRDAKEPDDGQT